MKRRLTTILYADAVRFSAQMEADEAATLTRLNRARAVMRELVDAHDGRVVNTWGDAVIAEFASVVEAVRCAVAVQEALPRDGGPDGEAAAMQFRIGVNLGDVMVDGDDIYGDGVNVAERLQGLAEPGGVMVSGAVRDLVRKQLALGFDYAGDQTVKSLSDPVASWRVRMDGRNAPPEEDGTAPEPEAEAEAPIPLPEPLARWVVWYRLQPRRVRRAAGMIVFFFLVNLLFGGLANPWFVFPSIPFAIVVLRGSRWREMPWRAPRRD